MNQTARNKRRHALRRGSFLIEVTASAAMLAVLLVIVNQVVVGLHRQNHLVDRYLLAQQTLENLLEEAVRMPWDSLDAESIASLELPEAAQSRLPQATLAGEVVDEAEPVPAKRITLQLSWRGPSGGPQRPLVLTTWVYQSPEEKP